MEDTCGQLLCAQGRGAHQRRQIDSRELVFPLGARVALTLFPHIRRQGDSGGRGKFRHCCGVCGLGGHPPLCPAFLELPGRLSAPPAAHFRHRSFLSIPSCAPGAWSPFSCLRVNLWRFLTVFYFHLILFYFWSRPVVLRDYSWPCAQDEHTRCQGLD